MPVEPSRDWHGHAVTGLSVTEHPSAGLSLVCAIRQTRHVVRAHRASDRPHSRASAWCRTCQSDRCLGCLFALDRVHQWRDDHDGPRPSPRPTISLA